MADKINENSLDTICAALCEIMGIAPPEHAAAANKALVDYAKSVFGGENADRIFMYNPDAIAQWLYEKYPQLFKDAKPRIDLELPLRSPMPSVTPVCFSTMYTGAQPEIHGFTKYEKRTIAIDTIFDALIRAGKKPAIVAYHTCTVGVIFKEREMDYFTYTNDADVHAKVAELILEDKYDFIAIHACNFDTFMHKYGTESVEALSELNVNSSVYASFDKLIRDNWKGHNVLMGFAMDHGCHDTDSGAGTHGLDMPEDLNITHLYKAYKKEI
jgi:predicted AlkP superfamily pyrophosphatase or phosphodiesterase